MAKRREQPSKSKSSNERNRESVGLFPLSPPPSDAPTLHHERLEFENGYGAIAGVDEVGRGALAGPVVAAAVVLDPENVPEGLDDSKRLTAPRREELAREIFARAIAWSVARIEPDVIDRINILRATLRAMWMAIDSLTPAADCLLVDGNVAIPDCPQPQRLIVRGDRLSASIAAASILAKVSRDRIMVAYDDEWPGYGFRSNVGYGTRTHLDAISTLGPTPIHRTSFRGVGPPKTNDQLNLPRSSN